MEKFISYFLESGLCLFVAWSFYKLVLEKLTFFSWNRAFLMVSILVSILFPFLDFNFLPTGTLPLNPIKVLESSDLTSPTNGNAGSKINYLSIGFYVLYASGLLWMMGKLLLGIFKTILMIRDSDKITYKGFKVALDPDFRPSSFFNYILMPANPTNSESFDQVFKHESMHVQLGHSYDVIFIQLVKSFLWFNPLGYLFEQSLKEVHEYQADAGVISEYSSISYSRLLVEFASSNHPNWQLISSFNQFQTKNRILMMHKSKSERKDLKRFFVGLLVLVSVGLMVSCSSGVERDDLVGTWKGDDFQFVQSEGPDLVAMIEGGRDLHEKSELILNEDGSYKIQVNGEILNGEGTWDVEGGATLVTDDGNEVISYEIVSFTDDKLVTKHQVEFETPMGKLAGTITQSYKR